MFLHTPTFSCRNAFFCTLLLLTRGSARDCGFNPGGAVVRRKNNSTYPYFGAPCAKPSDCGQCDLDDTCLCQDGCCAPTGGVFGNYTCLNQVCENHISPTNIFALSALLPVRLFLFPIVVVVIFIALIYVSVCQSAAFSTTMYIIQRLLGFFFAQAMLFE